MGQLFSWATGRSAKTPQLASKDLEGVAQYIASGKCKNIVVMTGAGISRAAGIPDFRSEGGLYNILRRTDLAAALPRIENIFSLPYFKRNPKPFYQVVSALVDGAYRPTLTHSFLRLLEKRRVLNACWTQNVDGLERLAGVSSWRLIQAHGHVESQHCTTCNAKFDDTKMKRAVLAGEVPVCERRGCKGFVKPDVVMFGESLPLKFWLNLPFVKRADLLIVIGTSLAVPPFSFIASHVSKSCPRVVINLEAVQGIGGRENDVQCLGDCDETVRRLTQLIGGGWEEQLDALWKETEDKVFRYKDDIKL
ncbi:DHS-like NAD/FAD-binding domain-containing protein [Mycena polygramma]|nr:DHS-like NAD/FAD-binding domain-containing protein [Mycena polygramma]